jgi:NADPH:quinone reductase-like Zn-dependent oxidoreductase
MRALVMDRTGDADELHIAEMPTPVAVMDELLLINAPSGSWPTLLNDATAAGVLATRYRVAADARALDVITGLIDAGTVRVHLERVLNVADGAEALRELERGHTRGKIVLRVAADA